MKIIQMNVVYNEGSTGKIVKDINNYLIEKGISSIVIYGRGKKVSDKNAIMVCNNFFAKINKFLTMLTGIMYGGCFFSTKKAIKVINKEKPNVVHLHCINGNFINVYRIVTWLKKHNIHTVVTLHGEFFHTANCGHAFECERWKTGCGKCPRLRQETKSLIFDNTHKSWILMNKAFSNFKNIDVVSVSPWLKERAIQSPILSNMRHHVILNGLDEKIFHYYEKNENNNICSNGKKIVFHATPCFNDDVNNLKGGHFLLKLAKKMENFLFIVAGPYSSDIEIPDNVILLGQISDQVELAKYYSLANLTLIVSKRETFSMVVAESLCCGSPVVGFKSGGPESIAIEEYSKFVDYGDLDSLQKAIEEMAQKGYNKFEISKLSVERYSKKNMCDEYEKLYKL